MVGRRHAVGFVLAVLVLSSTAVVGVRVADPFPEEGARPLDTTAPPGEVAVRALEQTERGDYTMVVWRSTWGEGSERGDPTFLSRYRVSTTRGRVRATVSMQGGYGHLYRNERCRWWRLPAQPRWRHDCSASHRTRYVERRFRERAARDAVVVDRNRTTLVLGVNDTVAAARVLGLPPEEDERTIRVVLYVERVSGHLDRVVYRERWRDGTGTTVVYEFSEWGDTRPRRPAGVPYTLAEFLADVATYRP